jgi:hypothetical protein
MEKYSYIQSIAITERALDLINVRKFLHKGLEPYTIMRDIEDDMIEYPNEYQEVINYMQTCPEVFSNPPEIFSYMTDDEFMRYCESRFPDIQWGHEIIEKYWVIGGDTKCS